MALEGVGASITSFGISLLTGTKEVFEQVSGPVRMSGQAALWGQMANVMRSSETLVGLTVLFQHSTLLVCC